MQNDTRQTTSYSMWNLFRNCRRACHWRYIKQIVPITDDERPLRFGTVIHKCLELCHGGAGLEGVLTHIDRCFVNRSTDPVQKQDWHYARAMMKAYASRYASEPRDVVALEKEFTGEIVNPATGAKSKSFILSGKVDGIVKKPDGTYYLLEHKTASPIDGDYVGKLWTDLQITLYSFYLREALGIPIEGVVYNVLVKPKLVQSAGETEEEFAARLSALAAKNKSGKSNATRRLPETDEEFESRLADWFAEKDRFLRVELAFDFDSFNLLRSELWELTQQYLDARRRDTWYQNTDFCFRWQRPCPYFAICSSKDNPLVIENQYQVKPAHSELSADPSSDNQPVF